MTNQTQSDANFNQAQMEYDNMSDQDANQPPSEPVPVPDLVQLCRIAYENTSLLTEDANRSSAKVDTVMAPIVHYFIDQLESELAFIRAFCERNGVEL